MKLLNYKIKYNFRKSTLGIFFTSFYGYFPYFASFFFILNNIQETYLKKKLLFSTIILLMLLFFSFLLTLNINIFRIFCLVILNLLLYSIFQKNSKKILEFQFLSNNLFYFHSLIIIIAFLFPKINTLLSGSDELTNRVGGLVGYDYMAFFYCTYLFSEYRCLDFKISKPFLIKILLSSFFIIISGRFGIILLLYFYVYLFLRKINLLKILSIFIVFTSLFFLFSDQITYLTASYKGFFTYIIDNNTNDLHDLANQDTDAGYYSASPITWVNMFIRPFVEIKNYLLPSSFAITIDPGPSYLILNIGFIFTIFIYLYFTFFFKIEKKIFWPLFIVYLLSDIKFHGIFVPACMFWLYLNIFKIRYYEQYNNLSFSNEVH